MENNDKFLGERILLTVFAIMQILLSFITLYHLYGDLSLNGEKKGFLLYELCGCLCMILLCVELYYSLRTFLTESVEDKFILQGKAWVFLFIAGFLYFVTAFSIYRKEEDDIFTAIFAGIIPFGSIVIIFFMYILERKDFFEKLNKRR